MSETSAETSPPDGDSGLEGILQKMSIPLTLADASRVDMPLVAANDAFLAFCGHDRAEIVGTNCRFLQGDLPNEAARAELRDAFAASRRVQVVLRNRHRDGRDLTNFLTVVPIPGGGVGGRLLLGAQFELTPQEERAVEGIAPPEAPQAVHVALSRHRALLLERRRIAIDATSRLLQSHLLLREIGR